MSKVTVLGAGLAGLSCAYHLDGSYQIFEKKDQIGGLCKSRRIDGYIFDYDGHLLHFKNNYVKGLIYNLLDGKLIRHKRNALVYSHGTYTEYPFQAKLYGLPASVIEDCLSGLIKIDSFNTEVNNFKQWVISNFGMGIAEHFMLPYNEKFWTISLEDLTTEWVDEYIPVPSLKQILHGGLQESSEQFGYNVNFWYPAYGGIEQVPKAFDQKVKPVSLNKKATDIDLKNKRIKFQDGNEMSYTTLVSTIPLPELKNILFPLPSKIKKSFEKLKFTSIYVLNLGIKRENISDAHWIYFPSKEFPFYRIGFPCNFSLKLVPPGYSSLYAEVTYSEYKSIEKKNINNDIIEKLLDLNILNSKKEIVKNYPMDIKYGYVIYDKEYKEHKNRIIDFLEDNNIFSIGRYGAWEYMSMEDVILDGKLTAEELNEK